MVMSQHEDTFSSEGGTKLKVSDDNPSLLL